MTSLVKLGWIVDGGVTVPVLTATLGCAVLICCSRAVGVGDALDDEVLDAARLRDLGGLLLRVDDDALDEVVLQVAGEHLLGWPCPGPSRWPWAWRCCLLP